LPYHRKKLKNQGKAGQHPIRVSNLGGLHSP
jgi:hypothetical protein